MDSGLERKRKRNTEGENQSRPAISQDMLNAIFYGAIKEKSVGLTEREHGLGNLNCINFALFGADHVDVPEGEEFKYPLSQSAQRSTRGRAMTEKKEEKEFLRQFPLNTLNKIENMGKRIWADENSAVLGQLRDNKDDWCRQQLQGSVFDPINCCLTIEQGEVKVKLGEYDTDEDSHYCLVLEKDGEQVLIETAPGEEVKCCVPDSSFEGRAPDNVIDEPLLMLTDKHVGVLQKLANKLGYEASEELSSNLDDDNDYDSSSPRPTQPIRPAQGQ